MKIFGQSSDSTSVEIFLKKLDSIRCELKKNENFKEVNLIHEKYKNGNSKFLHLLVKYFSDNQNKNWEVGPRAAFYENGKIKGTGNINIKNCVYQDTSFSYYGDGRLKSMEIYPKIFSDSVLYTNLFKSERLRTYYFLPNSQLIIYYLGSDKSSFKIISRKRILRPKIIFKKHGICKKYNHKTGKLVIEEYDMGQLLSKTIVTNSFSKNGLKDGIWTEYRADGKKKISHGEYQDDKRIGIWEFYDKKGVIEQKYDFSKEELSFFRIDDEQKEILFNVINLKDTFKTKLNRPPLFIGGTTIMNELISNKIRYPKLAMDENIYGTVYLTFMVDSTGKAKNYNILKGIGGGCDEEALKAIKELPNSWIPALLNGRAVNVEYLFPIRFTPQIKTNNIH